jgi:CubicO group peptidase (beta-lactamase class C family)
MVTTLRELLQNAVDDGSVPGAVALVARGDAVEVAAVGTAEAGGSAPMARDSIFRIASLTKAVTSALALRLIEDDVLAHDDPIGRWLPELANPQVVRTPDGPLDDLVPARRPITVADLLTSRAGWGFPDDFTWPAIGALFVQGSQQHGRDPQKVPGVDEWLKNLGEVPLVYQPGERWLYNTCSDLLGALMARATGDSLPDLMAERIFDPLGMTDTGFAVRADQLDRFTTFYMVGDEGLALADTREGQWSTLPPFPSGAGGLVSTVDDYFTFARTLLPGGSSWLSPESRHFLLTDHLSPEQRDASRLFLDGQGWGSGGSVDIAATEPWNVVGRYGWTGGTGTTAHVIPATGTVAILLTQVGMPSPEPVPLQKAFWTYSAQG